MAEHNTSNELFWTATRYVWGELPHTEAAAFEDILATDEAACLAVAEAVRLTAHLQAAMPQTTAVRATVEIATVEMQPRRPQRRWAAAWVTVALVAIATAGLAVRQAATAIKPDSMSSELLARWTDAGGRSDLDVFDDFDAEPELLDESLTAPGWMLHAVQLADDARTPGP